jgi:molybdate transport system regulatory protein
LDDPDTRPQRISSDFWENRLRLAFARGTVGDMARLKISIVFGSGARIGPGKAMLLQSIRDTGSISAAAREMGMSYKRAWLLLDSMNQAFTEPVVMAAPGGAGGGGATLTPFGAEVLERYRRIRDRAASMAAEDVAALARRSRPDTGPKI